MKKVLIISGVTLVVIIVILAAVGVFMKSATKAHSPIDTAVFSKNSTNLKVVYCRPYKKERVIFGELIPYNAVWRTGANEPTTFKTTTDIKIVDQLLPAGTYSLWTIPNENEWQIIFNSEIPNWGVDFSGNVLRNSESDAVVVTAPSYNKGKQIEQLTIAFEEMDNQVEMIIMWDKTTVVIPIQL